jgi:hypothetical protein
MSLRSLSEMYEILTTENRPGLPRGHLWLFAVDNSSTKSSLVPLMIRPVDKPVISASARNNTLAYIFVDGTPAQNILAIVELDFSANEDPQVPPRLYRLGPPFGYRDIYDVVVFFPDVVGVIIEDKIALFRIPEDRGQIDRRSSLPVLKPFWTDSPEDGFGGDGFSLGPLQVSNPDTCLLALCINYQSYTLQVSRNASDCELHIVSQQMCSFISGHFALEICLQGRGTCAICPWVPRHRDNGMLDIRLYRTPYFHSLIPYMDRMPSLLWCWDNEVPLSIPRPPEADVRSIGYDEWTGTVAIQWRRPVGGVSEWFMTVISLIGVSSSSR